MRNNKIRCTEELSDSYIKCEENGRKAIFENTERASYHRTKVDKCMVDNVLAADFMVTKVDVGDVIVELKGKDVKHGIEQALATAQLYKEHELRTKKIAALIVAKACPSYNSAVRKGKEQFARMFGGPLHVVTKNDTFIFEKVLDFKGPR